MIEAFKLFWQNYFNIKSRTRRRHYWFAILANCIILVIMSLLFNIITLGLNGGHTFLILCMKSLISLFYRNVYDDGTSFT